MHEPQADIADRAVAERLIDPFDSEREHVRWMQHIVSSYPLRVEHHHVDDDLPCLQRLEAVGRDRLDIGNGRA